MLRVFDLVALRVPMSRRDRQTDTANGFCVLASLGMLSIFCSVLIGCSGGKRPALLTHEADCVVEQKRPGVESPYWHAVFDCLRVGMAERELEAILVPKFNPVKTNTFIVKYPFKELLPNVDPSAVTEWQTAEAGPAGWPEVLFTIFSDSNKTNLVDAFWFRDGRMVPVVYGLFDRNVRAVKPGESIEVVFRVLGKREAEYFRGSDGRWRVRFIYWAYGGRIFVIECDAGEGKVLYAGDGTL